MDKEVLLAEYHEVAEGMRFHSGTRWQLLGIVVSIASGLLALSIQFINYRFHFYLFGLFLSAVFAFIEYRTQLMWHVLFLRAIEIESILGIQGAFTAMQLHKKSWLDSTMAIRFAYYLLIGYWIIALIKILFHYVSN